MSDDPGSLTLEALIIDTVVPEFDVSIAEHSIVHAAARCRDVDA